MEILPMSKVKPETIVIDPKTGETGEIVETFHVEGLETLHFEPGMKSWDQLVRERGKDQCANCGGGDHLAAKMIIPEASGGQKVPTNGVLLCRACDLASQATLKSGSDNGRRLVNFWISKELYEWMQAKTGFESMGALVRYLMSKYIENEKRFDDLEQYQDEGSDTKVNVWVDHQHYKTFKVLLDKRGMTVTNAFKSLLRMYQAEIANALSN
jgi:hypothetical protein